MKYKLKELEDLIIKQMQDNIRRRYLGNIVKYKRAKLFKPFKNVKKNIEHKIDRYCIIKPV